MILPPAFGERFAKAGGHWPNVKTDYGPQTLMQGWLPYDAKTFRKDVLGLVDGFVADPRNSRRLARGAKDMVKLMVGRLVPGRRR